MDNEQKYNNILNKYFKLDAFRDNQLEIIKEIIENKRDICAIMCTGAGKSLLYQFPPVFLDKTALVISPLISLMNDQQLKLNNLNISACCLNSTVNKKEQLKNDILDNKYNIVYTTPEYITLNTDFLESLNNVLCLVCIDESHTISSYGHEFRPSYKKLNIIKEILPDVPVLAVTATATPLVQEDIINTLKLDKPYILKSTFNRTNLNIYVKQKTNILTDLLKHLLTKEPTIIYAQTRKNTDTIAELLQNNNIKCKAYHAGMTPEDRKEVHKQFANKELDCVIATIAFGLGIDIVIRQVIHYGIPKDIESYYQEIGRAGRDGLDSNCYLYFAISDMSSVNYFISLIEDKNYKQVMIEKAQAMKKYVFSDICRRKIILNYFGEEYNILNCNKCDNCLNININKVNTDYTKEAIILYNIIAFTKSKYGIKIIVDILTGSKNKKIPDYIKTHEFFNSGYMHDKEWWRTFIRTVIDNEYIKEKSIENSNKNGFILALSDKANNMLNKDFNYSIPCIDVVDDNNTEPKIKIKTKKTTPKSNIKRTYDLLKQNKTVKEIAKEVNMTPATIENHIEKLYREDYDIDLTKFGITDEIYNKIKNKLIELNNITQLKPIKDDLIDVTYLQIKLCKVKYDKEHN